MPARRRDLEGALRGLLPADLSQIEIERARHAAPSRLELSGAPERPLAPERRDHLIEMIRDKDLEPSPSAASAAFARGMIARAIPSLFAARS